jgi:hypothetical protein
MMDLVTALDKVIEHSKKNLSLVAAVDTIVNYISERESYVKKLLTDEQILEFALRSIEAKDYNMETLEGEVIVAYIMQKHGENISPEKLTTKVTELIDSHSLKVLCEDGLLLPDFEKSTSVDVYYTVSNELSDILNREQ